MSIECISYVWKTAPDDAPASTILLLIALADYANDRGTCFPGIPALAKMTRLSERNVQLLLRKLELEGLISTSQCDGMRTETGRTNLYTITGFVEWKNAVDQIKTGKKQGVKSSAEEVKSSASRGEIQSSQEVKPASPDPLSDPSSDPLKNPNKNIPAKQVIPVPLKNMITNQLSSEDMVITDDDQPTPKKPSRLNNKVCHVWSLHTKTTIRKLGPALADSLASRVVIEGIDYSSPDDLWNTDEDFQDWVDKIVEERVNTGVIRDLKHFINWIRSYEKCGLIEFKRVRENQRQAALIKKNTKTAMDYLDERSSPDFVPPAPLTAEEIASRLDF